MRKGEKEEEEGTGARKEFFGIDPPFALHGTGFNNVRFIFKYMFGHSKIKKLENVDEDNCLNFAGEFDPKWIGTDRRGRRRQMELGAKAPLFRNSIF